MTFSSSISEAVHEWAGRKKRTYGTFTNAAGDTGGDIDTGLDSCEIINLTYSGSGALATAPAVNETLPVDGGAVTIVTEAGADGYWEAIGE